MADEIRLHHNRGVIDNSLVDHFTLDIPFSLMEDKIVEKLSDWFVEDFDDCRIDWENEKIVCNYITRHGTPKGHLSKEWIELIEKYRNNET